MHTARHSLCCFIQEGDGTRQHRELDAMTMMIQTLAIMSEEESKNINADNITTSRTSCTTTSSSNKEIRDAARAIAECDFLLVATGAGFSADSGLPTYTQVAQNPIYEELGIEYSDLCRVECLMKRPALFYGFWGGCWNAYQEATPHEGYTILKKWCCEQKKQQKNYYYHYTSNVDGYLRRVGFPKERIHEMHGSIDTWLLSAVLANNDDDHDYDDDHEDHEDHDAGEDVQIELSPSFRFPIDSATMELALKPESVLGDLLLAEENQKEQLSPPRQRQDDKMSGDNSKNYSNNNSSNISRRKNKRLFRPRVLMFDDGLEDHKAMGLHESSDRYQAWEEHMETEMANSSTTDSSTMKKKLVVLEIGCGIRVPSVRQECHDVMVDTATRCLLKQQQQQQLQQVGREDDKYALKEKCCTHIRINPDLLEEDGEDAAAGLEQTMPSSSSSSSCWDLIDTISIPGTALLTLKAIDEQMLQWNS